MGSVQVHGGGSVRRRLTSVCTCAGPHGVSALGCNQSCLAVGPLPHTGAFAAAQVKRVSVRQRSEEIRIVTLDVNNVQRYYYL